MHLQHTRDTTWHLELHAAVPSATVIFLRISHFWGGVNLTSGQALTTLPPSLDTSRRVQATIGPNGGMLQTTDASGASIRLDIPAAALSQSVAISMTPFSASPEVIDSAQLANGVQFEPDGLHFSVPARLSYTFPSALQVPSSTGLFLLTSPMTRVPLLGNLNASTRTLSAEIFHFSGDQPASPGPAATDTTSWANIALNGSTPLTEEEIASLLAMVALQQRVGCTTSCIDLARVAQVVAASVHAIVLADCPLDTADPSLTALQRWVRLDALVQQAGGSDTEVRLCEHALLGVLIERQSTTPAVPGTLAGLLTYDITADLTLQALSLLATTAQQLGFADLQNQALAKLDTAMRAVVQPLAAAARGDQSSPDATAMTEQAITLLQSEQSVASNLGVTSADPLFAGYLQEQQHDVLHAAITADADSAQQPVGRCASATGGPPVARTPARLRGPGRIIQ